MQFQELKAYRAAAFDIIGRKISATPSTIFRFIRKNAGKKVVSSTEMQAAQNLPSSVVSTITPEQLPCRLN